MVAENWRWWVGHDEERYHTECDTREEAARIASEEQDGGYICEALKPGNIELSDFFDADCFLDDAENRAYDDHADPEGGDPIFDVDDEQKKDLQSVVREAIKKWQDSNGLVFTGWQFQKMRNEEYVPAADNDNT